MIMPGGGRAGHSWQLADGNTVQIRQQESSDFGEADG